MSSLFTYDNFVHALAGSVANGTAMSVFYPLDTVRSRLQVDKKRDAKNTLVMLKEIAEEEGVEALYRGFQPLMYSIFCSGFVHFYSFHGLRRLAGDKTAIKDLICGALAGTINVLSTTPLWVVTMRLKMKGAKMHNKDGEQIAKGTENISGLTDGLWKIGNNEGLSALWSGAIPGLMLVSNPAIQFMIYEALKRQLSQLLNGQQLSPVHIFLVGAISKTISTLITYPLQLVQTMKRTGVPEAKDKPTVDVMKEIYNKNGTFGLYRGLESKLFQTVLTTALMYVFYDRIYNVVTETSKCLYASS